MNDPMTENTTDLDSTRYGSAIALILCVTMVLSVIAYGAVDTWALALLAFACTLIVWLWLAESWKIKKFTFNASLVQIPILGLIFLGLVQLLPLRGLNLSDVLSVPPSQTLTLDAYATKIAVIKLVVFLIYFAAALTFIVTKKRFRRVVFTIILFGAAIAAFAVFQKLVNPENIYGLRETVQAHTFGPYVNGHHFAALMEMTIGLSFGLLYGKTVRKELRIIFAVGILLMGAAVIMTGSRGGILSVLGVLGFITILNILKKKKAPHSDAGENAGGQKKMIAIGGGLAFILLMTGIGLLLGGDTALRTIGIDSVGSDISSGRLHFWSIALQIFRDNFLLGAGLEAFGVAFTRYDTWNGAFRVEQAHNDYLQILADSGIFGFLCVLGFICLLFRQGLKTIGTAADRFRNSAAIGALAGCFGVMIHSFFDFPLRTPANMLIFLTLAALAIVPVKSSRS